MLFECKSRLTFITRSILRTRSKQLFGFVFERAFYANIWIYQIFCCPFGDTLLFCWWQYKNGVVLRIFFTIMPSYVIYSYYSKITFNKNFPVHNFTQSSQNRWNQRWITKLKMVQNNGKVYYCVKSILLIENVVILDNKKQKPFSHDDSNFFLL